MSQRRARSVVLTFVVLAFAARVDALEDYIRVQPGNAHLSVEADKTDDGRIRFTIVRDPSQAPEFARNAYLKIASEAGWLAECAVEGELRDRSVSYSFDVSHDVLSRSSFTLREYLRPKEDGELQLGGATVYEVRLADFVPTVEPKNFLEDGVYPVLQHDPSLPQGRLDEGGVELEVISVEGIEPTASATVRVMPKPLLRFKTLTHFDFKFEMDECTQIGFQNTEELKAYTRDHVGARLAVVIGNRVVTHHKIREAITTPTVRITCCTVGGGDHLHKHLKELKLKIDSGPKRLPAFGNSSTNWNNRSEP